MILILRNNNFDYTIEKLIDWLDLYKAKYKVITPNYLLQINIQLFDDEI